MDISLLSDQDRQEWMDFVAVHPDCWHYHHVGWKEVIERAYGHRCLYLLARDKGQVTGVLPLVLIKSRLFGRSLTSLPYLDFAGLAAGDDVTRARLLQEATELAHSYCVGHLELRQTKTASEDLRTDTHKVSLVLDLPSTAERLWKSLPSERRNRIRKAQQAGLSVECTGQDGVPSFYRVWTENMRDLGSPPHSREFFENILRVFSSSALVILVKHGRICVGAGICLYEKGTLTLPWVSSLRQYRQRYPNNILYWEAMRLAIEKTCGVFDFGRSSVNSGTFTFKVRWGAVARPLLWQFKFLGREPAQLPGADDQKYRLGIAVWRMLPVGLTRLIGPALRKNITA